MSVAKFHKVAVLPGSLDSNAFYFIENGTYAESYVTNSSGVARSVGNSVMINALIASSIASLNTIQKVADISARNALTLTSNAMILVVDATGDGTVTAGSALYFYTHIGTTFTKVAEYESMDVTTAWTNITGKPTSAVADIDDAVTKRHSHSNMSVLDKWSESGGQPLYDGASVLAGWTTVSW